jgi:hypothetical protein
LQFRHRLAVAGHVDVQRAVVLRVDENDLEGGMVRAALELFAFPFDACLRVVLGICDKIIEIVAPVAIHLAVLPASLLGVEIVAEVLFKLADAGRAQTCGVAGQDLALAPVRGGHQVCMVEGQRAAPVFRAFKDCPEGVFMEARERGELFGQFLTVPAGFVQNRF